jgi:molybdate transport system ATP-binding protein
MIEVEIAKQLGDFRLDARFSVPNAGIVALFGPSGAGKTSIINAIAGLLRPDSGRIVLNGETLFSSTERIDIPPRRRGVGYVFQEGRLFPHVSVRRNLVYGMPKSRQAVTIGFDDVVALLGLEALLARRPGALSGGEKQRVAIGRALLAQPKLILMDEPLASLDAARKAEIMPFIERLHGELRIPIVYCSHDMDENMRLADTLVVMADGRAVAVGAVEELTSRLDLQPLIGRFDAGAIIRATVAGHDLNFGLSELAFPGGRLKVARVGLPLGTAVRARIRARDVAVATRRPEQISIRNILPARIVEVAQDPDRPPVMNLRLDIGREGEPVMLLARVTVRASRELNLSEGAPVFALIKTIALDRRSYVQFGPAMADAGDSL